MKSVVLNNNFILINNVNEIILIDYEIFLLVYNILENF